MKQLGVWTQPSPPPAPSRPLPSPPPPVHRSVTARIMLPVPIYTAGGGGRKYRAVSCLRKQHDGKDWALNHRQPPYDCVPAQRSVIRSLRIISKNSHKTRNWRITKRSHNKVTAIWIGKHLYSLVCIWGTCLMRFYSTPLNRKKFTSDD